MKLHKTLTTSILLGAMTALTGCDGEKDLIIIDGQLPIKASALYMVGDATPAGWNIGDPTPYVKSEDDPLIFTWDGELKTGEIKLCLITGSWDAPFIRPFENGTEINATDITTAKFDMHAGDPDNKWRVTQAGEYHLEFDLRHWTMSTHLVSATATPEPSDSKDPIQADAVYMVGDATPAGWNIDDPTRLDQESEYIFTYTGPLNEGEMKAYTKAGDWGEPAIRPTFGGCRISKDGVESNEFAYANDPDDKWVIVEAGNYTLTFDLENYTLKAEYIGEISDDKEPIETETLYIIGDATPGGWGMEDATAFSVSKDDKYVFTWEGELVEGDFKACLMQDGTYSCPFIRPTFGGCEVNTEGVESPDFTFSTSPDDKWTVTKAGKYLITFNLKDWTIKAEYKK